MIAENKLKNANYVRIVSILKNLLKQKIITNKEYDNAKKYYRSLTGADIIIAD
ncbi:MAG: hypothetical protein IKC03_08930 [Oscillospiraceae bacterium]|nr:hypothetical protein [Oscillospiraceae bacterium]